MNLKDRAKRFLGKMRRHLATVRLWWNSDIGRPKPIFNHNQKRIEYTTEKPIVEMLMRLLSEDARKISPCGSMANPSYSVTLDKTCALELMKTNPLAQVRVMQIDYMKIYDKDGLHVKETVVGEPAVLITRLLHMELEKT